MTALLALTFFTVVSTSAVLVVARLLEATAWRRSLLAIELRMPLGLTMDAMGRWLNTIAAATHPPRLALLPYPPVALEVMADAAGIRHVLLVPNVLRATVLSGLRAALPGVRLEEASDYLTKRPRCTVAIEAVLNNQRRQMSVDRAESTATAVLATLQPVDEDQAVIVQWIATGAGTPAPVPSLTQQQDDLPPWLAGEELTDAEAIRSARAKQTDALLRTVLRVGVAGSSRAGAFAVCGRVWGQL